MTASLRAGYARRCITPLESVPLGGYGNTSARMSDSVLSDLYSTCIALTDSEGSTVLLFHNDLISTPAVFTSIRQEIAIRTDLTVDRVLVAATHTHSAPDLNSSLPSIARYIPYVKEQMVDCALAALADRCPASISVAHTRTRDMAYVRHYTLENGKYLGTNMNIFDRTPIAYHSTEADNLMQLIKFSREGAKDVLLVNWQAHPRLTGYGQANKQRDPRVSSDMVGLLRDELEGALDCNFIYFTGAAGNIDIISRIPEENKHADPDDYYAYGRRLAMHAMEAARHFRPIASGPVRVASHVAHEPMNIPDPQLAQAAEDVWAHFVASNNDHHEGVRYAESKGFHSQYHASQLLNRIRRYQNGERELAIEMYAVRAGDLGLITAPYEMFDTNGKYVRDFSPFAATIVASCANGANNYIPSAFGFIAGCYEADNCALLPGAGERLAQKYVKMLESLTDESM